MLTRRLLIVLISVALVLSLSPAVVGAQQPSTYAALTITDVTSGTPAVGSDFTTDVQLSVTTNQPGVVGVELYENFDSTQVEALDTDAATPGVQPAELRSSFFGTNPIPAANEVIIAANTIAPGITVAGRACPVSYPCVHLSLVGPAQTNRTGVIARLHWRGVTASPLTSFAVQYPGTGVALSDADGYLIPVNAVTVSNFEILAGGSLGGIVLRQGVPPAVPGGTQGCTKIDATNGAIVAGPTYTVYPAPVAPAPPQVQTAGGFYLTPVTAGTYTVRATYLGYLPAQKSNVFISGGQVLIGTTKLYGGDVNGDNTINILDIVSIIGRLGTTGVAIGSAGGCPGGVAGGPDDGYDINDDGTINISDLAITSGNMGKTGPTTWAP